MADADAPASPVPTTMMSNFRLLFGLTRLISNLWFSHMSSIGWSGTLESSVMVSPVLGGPYVATPPDRAASTCVS